MRFVHTLYRTGASRSANRLHAGECKKNSNQASVQPLSMIYPCVFNKLRVMEVSGNDTKGAGGGA